MNVYGKVVSFQVVPFRIRPSEIAEYGVTVEAQESGADEHTSGWGVYVRHENGMAMWCGDFDHPMDAVEFALEEINDKFPYAFIERSAWASTEDIDTSQPYLRILRRPSDKQYPYAVFGINCHPGFGSSKQETEAKAVEFARYVSKKENIPIAPYRWQK